MEIFGCGASRAGWSVMLSGYMEWNFWPPFDQKRCQHMRENPTTHTRGASYSRGGILLNVSVFSGNMVPFGFEEEQRNPDLAQFADAWTASQMRQKNKLNSLSNGLKRSYREVDDWWEKHKTLCLFKKSLLEKLWTQRILAELNMCDWTWQHGHTTSFSPSKVVHYFPNFRNYFSMEYEQPWNMGKILLEW